MVNFFTALFFVIRLIILGAIIYLLYNIITEPEILGQWFGKIVKGFKAG